MALNPNYAQGLYSLAFTHALRGNGDAALEQARHSLRLSPLDPFVCGMMGTQAIALLHAGQTAQAAAMADRGARAPGAHYLISLLAVAMNELSGNRQQADYWARDARDRRNDATRSQFLKSFPFRDPDIRRRVDRALQKNGF